MTKTLASRVDDLPYRELIAIQKNGIEEEERLAVAAHEAAYAAWLEAGKPYTCNDADRQHPYMQLRSAQLRNRRIARLAAAAEAEDAEAVDAAITASLEERRDFWRRFPPPAY